MPTTKFKKDRNNADSMISINEFYPRILCATSLCIGTVLDISDVKVVVRDGTPETLIDFCQEMERSGCSLNNDGLRTTDSHHLLLRMADYACLFEKIFGKSGEHNNKI